MAGCQPPRDSGRCPGSTCRGWRGSAGQHGQWEEQGIHPGQGERPDAEPMVCSVPVKPQWSPRAWWSVPFLQLLLPKVMYVAASPGCAESLWFCAGVNPWGLMTAQGPGLMSFSRTLSSTAVHWLGHYQLPVQSRWTHRGVLCPRAPPAWLPKMNPFLNGVAGWRRAGSVFRDWSSLEVSWTLGRHHLWSS